MEEVNPSNPFHIARAYRAPVPAPAAPLPSPPASPTPAPRAVRAESEAGIAGAIGPRRTGATARLVAGVVPGGIDFSTPQPTASKGSLAFYRHPADQNAAATVLARGRHVDVEG